MNKPIKKFLLFFLSIFLTVNVVDYLIRLNKPKFQDVLIESYKKDASLIAQIGSYSNHEFSYPTSELDLDSLHFQLIIFGTRGSVTYSGCAEKVSSGNWVPKRIETTVDK